MTARIAPPDPVYGRPGLLIDGRTVTAMSARTFASIDPSSGEVIAEVADGDREDVDLAVKAARRALAGEWAAFKSYDRQRMLLRFADIVEAHFDELARMDAQDMGMPVTRATAAKRRIVGMLRWYAALAVTTAGDVPANSLPGHVISLVKREPVGVVGAITPWNGPLTATVWKLGPVLATGCTLVLKPSEFAPLSALRLGELLLEAGLPPGVVNVVSGTGDRAGAALVAHPGVDKVAFTGSPAVGRKIIAASTGNVKRLTLELGGKSPNIVFADADMDAAVRGAAMAIFANSGQVCSAGSRLYVEAAVHDEFIERLVAFARTLKVGPALAPDTDLGPLVSLGQLERVERHVANAEADGARLASGGRRYRDGPCRHGYFMTPTIFTSVRHGSPLAREEVFGPVLATMSFATEGEVVAYANDSALGLGCGIWTRDVARAHRLADGVRAGSVWINCYNYLDPAVPFGGYRQSGYGRESGRQQLEDYLETKAVWIEASASRGHEPSPTTASNSAMRDL